MGRRKYVRKRPSAPLRPPKPSSPSAARRFDKWIVIGPGGGGAQFYPAVSPHDPGKVFLCSDMSQGFVSDDGGRSWRMFNIRGAIRFFAFDPVDADTVYAKSATALWRTTDGGRTWNLVHPAPDNVAKIIALEDHAWEKIITKDGSRETVEALAVDPSDSHVLYASMLLDGASAIHVSKDHGATWRKLAGAPHGCRKIYVDPNSPRDKRSLYVAGADRVSVLSGGKWTHHPAPEGVTAISAVSPAFPADGGLPVIYATSGPSFWTRGESSVGVFVSGDGGTTWQRCDEGLRRQFESAPGDIAYTTVAGAPSDGDVAYVSYRVNPTGGGLALFMGVAKTTDRGKTWKLVWKDSTTKPGPGMKDAWMNERFGPEWGENPFCLDVAATDPDVVYATDFGRTLRTTNGGKTWVGVYSKKRKRGWATTGLDMTTCYGVHYDPFETNRLWIDYTDIGAFVSDDGGTTWTSGTGDSPHMSFRETEAYAPTDPGAASGPALSTGVPRPWVNTTYWMQFDPAVKGRVWAVMSGIHDLPFAKMWKNLEVSRYNGGVCRSDDGGRTWRPSNKGMPETACTHIILDPNSPPDARVLYVTGFGTGVWKSVDGGASWTLKKNGILGEEPFAWRLTLDPEGVLYLVVARRSWDGGYGNDWDGRLYRSIDAAETWREIPLPKGVNGPFGLTVDPRDTGRLYLAVWGRYHPDGDVDGGIYLSTDKGGSWQRIFDRQQHVYDVNMDPRNPDVLYAGTMNFSVWKSADSGRTWRRLKGYNFKQAKRVIPDPFRPNRIFVTTFGGSVWYGPADGDDEAVEDIVTPVVDYSIYER